MQVRKSITAEIRKEIFSKHQSGTSVSKPRAEYGMAKSATCSKHKNKDELKCSSGYEINQISLKRNEKNSVLLKRWEIYFWYTVDERKRNG